MESLGRVQIRATNGQYWVAKPAEDYSAIVLTTSTSDENTWFDIMKLSSGNEIAFQSSVAVNGEPTYVSARPDWYGKLELQAAHSGDWITEVRGDETFALINIGGGKVAFKLINPSSYVSARLDTKDDRTDNDGYVVSVREGFSLFDGDPYEDGSYVESVGDWEKFELAGVDEDTISRIMAVAVTE